MADRLHLMSPTVSQPTGPESHRYRKMPLDALNFELVFFLCLTLSLSAASQTAQDATYLASPLASHSKNSDHMVAYMVQVLVSFPTEPYFHAWRSEGGPERMLRYSQRTAVSGQRNVSQRDGGEGEWVYSPDGFGDEGELFQVRRLYDVTGKGYLGAGSHGDEPTGAQSYGNSYSSHLKCGGESLEGEGTEKGQVAFPSAGGRKADERINFQEGRNKQSGTSKEAERGNRQIATPKGGRRPSHGNSVKNQNRPLNALSTTEKASGPKRPRPGAAKPLGSDIVFPDGYPKLFVPRVTNCATNLTFCEELQEGYPGEYISQVLQKEGMMFREFFGQDMVSYPDITERINPPEEESSLCPYRQQIIYPKAAKNKEEKWLFIVNQDKYVQGVAVELCLKPEDPCLWTQGFPLGYKAYCKQKYIGRRLMAIGEDGKLQSDSFKIPSCCSCVVKQETSVRMAPLQSPRGGRAPVSPGTRLP